MSRFAALVMTAMALGVCSCGVAQAPRSSTPAAPLLSASVPPVTVTVAPVPNLPAALIALGGVDPSCRPGTERPDGWCDDLGFQIRWYASRLPIADTAQDVLASMSWSKYYRIVGQYRGAAVGGGYICDIKLRSIGRGKGSIDVLVERPTVRGFRDPRRYGVQGAVSEVQVLVEPKALSFHQG